MKITIMSYLIATMLTNAQSDDPAEPHRPQPRDYLDRPVNQFKTVRQVSLTEPLDFPAKNLTSEAALHRQTLSAFAGSAGPAFEFFLGLVEEHARDSEIRESVNQELSRQQALLRKAHVDLEEAHERSRKEIEELQEKVKIMAYNLNGLEENNNKQEEEEKKREGEGTRHGLTEENEMPPSVPADLEGAVRDLKGSDEEWEETLLIFEMDDNDLEGEGGLDGEHASDGENALEVEDDSEETVLLFDAAFQNYSTTETLQLDFIQTQRDSTPRINPSQPSGASQLSLMSLLMSLLKSQDHRIEEAVQKIQRELESIQDRLGQNVTRESLQIELKKHFGNGNISGMPNR